MPPPLESQKKIGVQKRQKRGKSYIWTIFLNNKAVKTVIHQVRFLALSLFNIESDTARYIVYHRDNRTKMIEQFITAQHLHIEAHTTRLDTIQRLVPRWANMTLCPIELQFIPDLFFFYIRLLVCGVCCRGVCGRFEHWLHWLCNVIVIFKSLVMWTKTWDVYHNNFKFIRYTKEVIFLMSCIMKIIGGGYQAIRVLAPQFWPKGSSYLAREQKNENHNLNGCLHRLLWYVF